jgi:hypothetical protein
VGPVHPADSLFTILVTDQFNFVFSPLILGHVSRDSEGGFFGLSVHSYGTIWLSLGGLL